jgi:hypothetical protein
MLYIPLPLMIFIRMHSQESKVNNKCLICSIMSVIYVQFATFVCAFGTPIQTLVMVDHFFGQNLQKVILQAEETFQTKYRINHYDVFIINVQ